MNVPEGNINAHSTNVPDLKNHVKKTLLTASNSIVRTSLFEH